MQDTLVATEQKAPTTHPPERHANVRDSERVASTMAGGAMALYGLRDARDRVPALLVGGYLRMSTTCASVIG